jgi:hypothetical protein
MSWFSPEYRIVKDRYCGYEVQKRVWWLPFWRQVGFCNTHSTVEKAEAFAAADVGQVVKYLGRLDAK